TIGATAALGIVLASGLARDAASVAGVEEAWPDGPLDRGTPPPRPRVEPLELARVPTPLLGLGLVRLLPRAAVPLLPLPRRTACAGEVRRSTEARVLLSSEFFADVEADRIPRIADDLGRERLHVVVTLRPLSRLLASQWQQYVQSFMRLSYDDWLDAVLNGPPGKVTPTSWRRHRHDELIERWAAVVGPERMSVVVIDEDDHDQVLRVFEQLLGLRAGTLVAEGDVTSRSMTLHD